MVPEVTHSEWCLVQGVGFRFMFKVGGLDFRVEGLEVRVWG
jgi:hypothetical protein